MKTNNSQIHPTAFVSYAWESKEHKQWVKEISARLRSDGVDILLDQWSTVPGDQLPRFMEAAVRDNDFVLIICTPVYKEKSDNRKGGVGYEGDIMTSQVYITGNDKKFIPILRDGDWSEAAPTWIQGKFYIDLCNNPYDEENYRILLETLHGIRPEPPNLGEIPDSFANQFLGKEPLEPLSIEEVLTIRKNFKVDVLSFDVSQEIGIEFPYSDYIRLRITNNSQYVLPNLTVQTTRLNRNGKRVGSSRAPSIHTINIKPGETFETDYYPKGHLPYVEDLKVEIEHVINEESMKFFKELEPFL